MKFEPGERQIGIESTFEFAEYEDGIVGVVVGGDSPIVASGVVCFEFSCFEVGVDVAHQIDLPVS